jgi:hypothetical protein
VERRNDLDHLTAVEELPIHGKLGKSVMDMFALRLHFGLDTARQTLGSDRRPPSLVLECQSLLDWYYTAGHRHELEMMLYDAGTLVDRRCRLKGERFQKWFIGWISEPVVQRRRLKAYLGWARCT